MGIGVVAVMEIWGIGVAVTLGYGWIAVLLLVMGG